MRNNPPLGDLMTALYRKYLVLYGDEDLAALATANEINAIYASLAWVQKARELEAAA